MIPISGHRVTKLHVLHVPANQLKRDLVAFCNLMQLLVILLSHISVNSSLL